MIVRTRRLMRSGCGKLTQIRFVIEIQEKKLLATVIDGGNLVFPQICLAGVVCSSVRRAQVFPEAHPLSSESAVLVSDEDFLALMLNVDGRLETVPVMHERNSRQHVNKPTCRRYSLYDIAAFK